MVNDEVINRVSITHDVNHLAISREGLSRSCRQDVEFGVKALS